MNRLKINFLSFDVLNKASLAEDGFSLVEILIVIGLMGIVLAANLAMFSSQVKENQALSEQVAVTDIKRLLISVLGSGRVCTSELASTTFNPSGPYKIDTTSLAAQQINLNVIHSSPLAGAPALLQVDGPASVMSPRLKVDSIKFRNFKSTGQPDTYSVDFEVRVKESVRPLSPIVMNMIVETVATDPPNARAIKGCAEVGKSGHAYRLLFTSDTTWTVPDGVKSAFVTAAGGGGSGAGWKVTNPLASGHSGGYVFSHPINLVPGETITITVGKGGAGYAPYQTTTVADAGPPYYVYAPPAGDDGLGGYPGTATRITSAINGVLLECGGGGGAKFMGIDSYSGPSVPGDAVGIATGGVSVSGVPTYPSPNRPAAGPWGGNNAPGTCGPDNYGVGNYGATLWGATSGGPPSGYYPGGLTPVGYGSGGATLRMGCYVNPPTIGTCTSPHGGRDGVVMLDVWY